MVELYNNFQGYLQLNLSKIKWILLFGIVFYGIFFILEKKGYTKKQKGRVITMINGIILSLNCSFIFVMTLFGREMGETRSYRLLPFESYGVAFFEGNIEILLQIVVNIAMYVPLSILLPVCFRWFERYRNVVLVVTISSLAVELIQVIFKMGMFEVDDVISSVLGTLIGLAVYAFSRKAIQR